MRYVPACAAAVGLMLSVAGCTSESATEPGVSPSGPDEVELSVVTAHAEQFERELPNRPAGSQQEFAAATYILGHLQQAGYVPLLDAVPFEDLVRSTNVVAPPPNGGDPRVVVAVPYDTGAPIDGDEDAIGLFLEIARALRVREPDAPVEFVALAAESATANEGSLGSRRLAKSLLDDEPDPLIVYLRPLGGAALMLRGAPAPQLIGIARDLGVEIAEADAEELDGALQQAGFEVVWVNGPVDGVGRVLVEFLAAV